VTTPTPSTPAPTYGGRVRGCLLGGAIGDALGAGIEFDSIDRIRREHGEAGVTGYIPAYGTVGAVTDDTQMVLATLAGILADGTEGVPDPPVAVHAAYLRWWLLQTSRPVKEGTWVDALPLMAASRAPGNACMSGLGSGRLGTRTSPVNADSKGCGTVMRSAPFGLLPWLDPAQSFAYAAVASDLTHGHPTARTSAGAFAMLVRHTLDRAALPDAAAVTIGWLAEHEPAYGAETLRALRAAVELAGSGAPPTSKTLARLGEGWVAEEALAISLWCALVREHHPEQALLLAVNHSGDSDSTGAITGNIIGAAHGEVWPAPWVEDNEARNAILRLADEFDPSSTDTSAFGPATRSGS